MAKIEEVLYGPKSDTITKEKLFWNNGGEKRIFPQISLSIYEPNNNLQKTPDGEAAVFLLNLTNQNFTVAERFFGIGIGIRRIAIILLNHKLALQAESASQWKRADFFWSRLYKYFDKLFNHTETWSEIQSFLSKKFPISILGKTQELKKRLLRELFIDTHIGFYNGYLHLGERAFVHQEYIQFILTQYPLPDQSSMEILIKTQIIPYKDKNNWQLVIDQSKSIANAHRLWKNMDLAEGEYSEDRALRLLHIIPYLLKNPPAQKTDIPMIWKERTEEFPKLKEFDSLRICQFLERNFFPKTGDKEGISTEPTPIHYTILEPQFSTCQPGEEPFLYWFFSPSDLFLKFQTMMAVIITLLVTGVNFYESHLLYVRNTAYKEAESASQENDYAKVIHSSVVFCNHLPMYGRDKREKSLRNMYYQSFFRYFAEKRGNIDQDIKASYQVITNKITIQGQTNEKKKP
jgi:hypothetical protein